MIRAKSCPFCGGENVKIHIGYNHSYVMCEDCQIKTRRYKCIDDAVNAWNKRVE